MDVPDRFEITGSRAFYRPVGAVSLAKAVDLVSTALAYTREQGASELLANITGLSGFASPSLADRYLLVEKWAAKAAGKVRLAVVAQAEMIDPQKFGVTAAANRGFVTNIFTTEAEALAWLDGKQGSVT
jgi:hypothetical protein